MTILDDDFTQQGALLAGVLTSTGSWPSILPNGTRSPWTVRACWYCGILLALASVLTAAQQSIRLHRLSCHRRPNTSIRRLLRQAKLDPTTGKYLPRRAQVYTWQLSALLLTLSVLAMFGGMFILIWSSTGTALAGFVTRSWWNPDSQLAVTFSVVAFLIFLAFVFEQVTLYSWSGKDDSTQVEEDS